MRDDTYREELECRLTPKEWEERSSQLASKIKELAQHQEVEKLRAQEAKLREKGLTKDVQRLSEAVDTRKESRPVEVFEEPNHAKGTITIVRTDTHEAVPHLERPMSDKELEDSRQGKLFGRDRSVN